MGIRAELHKRRVEILELAERYGANNLRLFGSVARGDDTDNSDVDILIVLEPGRSLMDHAALKVELEDLLGRSVDIATESGLKSKFRERILREAVTL